MENYKPDQVKPSEPSKTEVRVIGPFERFKVKVDGYIVPRLEIVPVEGTDGDLDGELVTVLVDEHFCGFCTKEEVQRWAPLIANAMAVASGFTCHGENSRPANPYKDRVMCFGSVINEPGLPENG